MLCAGKRAQSASSEHGERQSGEPEKPKLKEGKRRKRRLDPGTIGELGEAAFLRCAMEHGLTVARPWGNGQRYDFLVQAGANSAVFHRVQVKCTNVLNTGGYQIGSSHLPRSGKRTKYRRSEVDFLVAYVIPYDAFYILPIGKCRYSDLRFYPHGSKRHREKYESFRERWELLGGKKKKVLGREEWPGR